MKTLTEFKESLNSEQPVYGLSVQLKSLWYDGKGDWDQAHAQVDHLGDKESAWVHAYLHRKEGDIGNAGYWYRRAGKPVAAGALEAEWEGIVSELLGRGIARS